jgi:hypothetical protein
MKAKQFSLNGTLAEIQFRQPPVNSRQWQRLAGGNPLGYRHRQPCAISARTPQGNSRQAAEPHPKTLRKPVPTHFIAWATDYP